MPEQVPLLTVTSGRDAPAPSPRGASPTKVFRPWSPEQAALLPASKRDYLGDDHLAVFLLDVLPTLELGSIRDAYAEDRGQPPYDPRMLTVLLLYAYSQRITSSRQIERRCREDVAFMYLAGDAQPDHDTICAFRRRHLNATVLPTGEVLVTGGTRAYALSTDGLAYNPTTNGSRRLRAGNPGRVCRAPTFWPTPCVTGGMRQEVDEEFARYVRARQHRLLRRHPRRSRQRSQPAGPRASRSGRQCRLS